MEFRDYSKQANVTGLDDNVDLQTRKAMAVLGLVGETGEVLTAYYDDVNNWHFENCPQVFDLRFHLQRIIIHTRMIDLIKKAVFQGQRDSVNQEIFEINKRFNSNEDNLSLWLYEYMKGKVGVDKIGEGGDILWYLNALAEAEGFTLEEMAQNNLDKIKGRYPELYD